MYISFVKGDDYMHDSIIIRGLNQNNAKNISLNIPKNKIVVFTGLSGSGKSTIVFDTIAAESQRQMNETYSSWARTRLPKYEKPNVEFLDNLSASVIINQDRLGGNARSTVGTVSDMYSLLRLLYSRIGTPSIGPASLFSFNNPNGMCENCFGIGRTYDFDVYKVIDENKSLKEGMINLPAFNPGNYYYKVYTSEGWFDEDKKFKDYSEEEVNLLLYGRRTIDGDRLSKKIEGIKNQFQRLVLMKGEAEQTDTTLKKIGKFVNQCECPVCKGKRLNAKALSVKVLGYTISEMCEMEFTELVSVLKQIDDPRGKSIVDALIVSLNRMIDIGLPYLFMNRETETLSGGEAQRVKLVRYMGSNLTGMTYIFDEPSVGMHPRDVYRMTDLLKNLRDKGNTVLVVEHDKDIISIADHIIDIGPKAGKYGGEVMFEGTYEDLLKSNTITGVALRNRIELKKSVRIPNDFYSVNNASIHNLKNVSVKIPKNVLTVVTGVAGSGKSSLIRDVFAKKYKDDVVLVDQSSVTATNRSTICTFLGFFDDIRKAFAKKNNTDASLFSFNSKGACPKCNGRGYITTELIFMDPVTTTCEYCNGNRYSEETLNHKYNEKTIVDVLKMSVKEALNFFKDNKKIFNSLSALNEVGLDYISLGQPLSTLSGGERQRVKLAKDLYNSGSIYILDEPTTGLHKSDIEKLIALFEKLVDRGNTVVVIEHNTDVMKLADYIIDVGPDGGSKGGEIVFTGTPAQLLESNTITAEYLRNDCLEEKFMGK